MVIVSDQFSILPQVQYESKQFVTMTEPYIPGFLAFREVKFLLERLEEVKAKRPEFTPQVHCEQRKIVVVDIMRLLHNSTVEPFCIGHPLVLCVQVSLIQRLSNTVIH